MAQSVRAPCLYKVRDREITEHSSCYTEAAGSSPAGSIFFIYMKIKIDYLYFIFFLVLQLYFKSPIVEINNAY